MCALAFRVQLYAFALLLPVAVQAADRDSPVIEKLHTTIATLRAEGIKLIDADFEPLKDEQPAEAVTAAGPEFVAAWREYRRAMSLRTKFEAQPVRQQGTNVVTARDEYQKLVGELIKGDKPPTPEQLACFFYSDYGWCGTPALMFADDNQRAILLACLRHRRFGEAVRIVMLSSDEEKVRADLLTALGFDWRKVVAGAWLAGKGGMLASLCKDGSEDTAQLVLRWAERHWDKAVAKRDEQRRTGVYSSDKNPQMPAVELLHLLKSDNTVARASKERIAAFLNVNATRLYDIDAWFYELSRLPRDTVSWLKQMTHAALKHEKNKVRGQAERILHEAGETDVKAELRPSPGFRLFVNGQLWPDFVNGLLRPGETGGFRPDLGLSVDYFKGGDFTALATSPSSNREGTIEPDADAFIPPERVRRAHFYSFPSSVEVLSKPEVPWIRAEIPLPPAFGKTTEIHVETVKVTIQPRFPRPLQEFNDKVSHVDFGYEGNEGSMPILRAYRLEGSGPLVLERVQPGEYVLRVRAPGTALMALENVRVTQKTTRFEPKLSIGSTVMVPLIWPDGFEIEQLDPEIADVFRRRSWAGLPGFFAVQRDGKPFTDLLPGSSARQNERASQMDRLVLPNLPTGKYAIRLRSTDDIRRTLVPNTKPDGARAGWKQAEVTFEVTDSNAAECITRALKIEGLR